MDEERSQSFYAPKKLFQKRLYESWDYSNESSINLNQYSDSDFGGYPVSSLSPPYQNRIASPLSSFIPSSYNSDNRSVSADDSNSFASDFLNGTYDESNKSYRSLSGPTSNGYIHVANDHRVHSLNGIPEVREHQTKYPPLDVTFIKTEPDDSSDYCSYFSSKDYSSYNSHNTYESCSSKLNGHTHYTDVQTEPQNLSTKQTRGRNCELIKEKLLKEKSSPFLEKFSQILKSLRSQITEDIPEKLKLPKTPIHYSNIKSDRDFSLLKFSLTDVKLEAMDDLSHANCSDTTLTELAPVMAKFDDQVSSTNFGFETGSNSSLGLGQTVNQGDFNGVMDIDLLKSSSFPTDISNNVSSSDSKLEAEEGTSHRKQGKKWMKGDMVCQVCGDKAAGFYCGAFACEACKVMTYYGTLL